MHKKLLKQDDAVLLIIDVQEKFKKAMPNYEEIVHNVATLAKAAQILELPVVYTEQYPKGLGATVEEVKKHLDGAKYFEKNQFSCCKDEYLMEYMEKLGRKQVIVCGLETHVCVSQTALDLLHFELQPHIIKDAVVSRSKENKKIGIEKMVNAGAIISCVEMALFELMKSAKHQCFKDVQKLIV